MLTNLQYKVLKRISPAAPASCSGGVYREEYFCFWYIPTVDRCVDILGLA